MVVIILLPSRQPLSSLVPNELPAHLRRVAPCSLQDEVLWSLSRDSTMKLTKHLTVYLPDTRDVEISSYGKGNLKLGSGVFSYSRLAKDTCPGATIECLSCCYALRIGGVVKELYIKNSATDDVPPIPEECKLLRLHVSGDFNSVGYIENWIGRLLERPDVTCWVYTRSWRVPELLFSLGYLAALPNVQMFASMDASTTEIPPVGWRRAWIDGDPRAGDPQLVAAHCEDPVTHNLVTFDGTPTYVCPEETGRQPNCEACKYCFAPGGSKDVTFLRH